MGRAVGKGDLPPASLSKKDAEKEREADTRLPDPPLLPAHLLPHVRRTSRVDVDVRFPPSVSRSKFEVLIRSAWQALYADSPIDAGLLALYLHQNYTQYCDELEQCVGVAECLSWVDASGGELVRPPSPSCPLSLLLTGALWVVAPGEPAPLSLAHARHAPRAPLARVAPGPEEFQARVLRRAVARAGG